MPLKCKSGTHGFPEHLTTSTSKYELTLAGMGFAIGVQNIHGLLLGHEKEINPELASTWYRDAENMEALVEHSKSVRWTRRSCCCSNLRTTLSIKASAHATVKKSTRRKRKGPYPFCTHSMHTREYKHTAFKRVRKGDEALTFLHTSLGQGATQETLQVLNHLRLYTRGRS